MKNRNQQVSLPALTWRIVPRAVNKRKHEATPVSTELATGDAGSRYLCSWCKSNIATSSSMVGVQAIFAASSCKARFRMCVIGSLGMSEVLNAIMLE